MTELTAEERVFEVSAAHVNPPSESEVEADVAKKETPISFPEFSIPDEVLDENNQIIVNTFLSAGKELIASRMGILKAIIDLFSLNSKNYRIKNRITNIEIDVFQLGCSSLCGTTTVVTTADNVSRLCFKSPVPVNLKGEEDLLASVSEFRDMIDTQIALWASGGITEILKKSVALSDEDFI